MSVAIKTITNLVLISIDPFTVRKIFLVLLALVCFSAFCFADPVFMAQHYAPATKEMETGIKPALEWDRDSDAQSGLTRRVGSMPFRALDLPRSHRPLSGFEHSDGILKPDNPSAWFQQNV
jgi:hypothetical protein